MKEKIELSLLTKKETLKYLENLVFGKIKRGEKVEEKDLNMIYACSSTIEAFEDVLKS